VTSPVEGRLVKSLAIAAIALALLAPFAGSPYAAQHASIDVTDLAGVVAREEDHVTALELATWIKERHAGLRVIDVRDAAAFAEYHIPTAELLALDTLVRTSFLPSETIVLYSDGGAHAAQGWTFLRALGYRRVFFLRGGLNEWLEMVISPTLPEAPRSSERARFDSIAALSRYFGGVPKRVATDSTSAVVPLPSTRFDPQQDRRETSSSSSIIARMRKRGC